LGRKKDPPMKRPKSPSQKTWCVKKTPKQGGWEKKDPQEKKDFPNKQAKKLTGPKPQNQSDQSPKESKNHITKVVPKGEVHT